MKRSQSSLFSSNQTADNSERNASVPLDSSAEEKSQNPSVKQSSSAISIKGALWLTDTKRGDELVREQKEITLFLKVSRRNGVREKGSLTGEQKNQGNKWTPQWRLFP